MDVSKISQYLASINQPKYRIGQIIENYYSGKFRNFSDMTNISKQLRQELENRFVFLSVEQDQISKGQNSIKARLILVDSFKIETVLLKYKEWNTICLSTQVGCAMGCKFCATGLMGFKRNLTSEEIVDQIIYWKQQGYQIDRIVFMGMGEPFMNWNNTRQAMEEINQKMIIGWRKMTVSTVGIIEGINQFTAWGKEVNLAISLHSLDQQTRQKIMPITGQNHLDDLLNSCRDYVKKSKRLLFFEYALMDDINDSEAEAVRLAKFINSHRLFFANLILMNKVKTSALRPSPKMERFRKILDQYRIKYSIRMSLGGKIEGACGQLVTSNE